MKATIKHCLINLELIAILCSVILGIGAAESSMWFQSCLFLFGPFAYGKIVGFDKHIEFLEAYDRAYRLKLMRDGSYSKR